MVTMVVVVTIGFSNNTICSVVVTLVTVMTAMMVQQQHYLWCKVTVTMVW